MNESGTKKREWIKTVAIIFLSVLLLLTFFSNTIMNYSLPEVAAQYVEPGNITAKVRGTGVIESDDPYQVEVIESRKIKSIAVKVGDHVAQGDVIFYLDDTESEELKVAQEALEAAQDAYDVALLSAEVTYDAMKDANNNTSTASFRQLITEAQNAVTVEQKKVDEWQKKYDQVESQLISLPTNIANVREERKAFQEAKTAKEKADFVLKEANNKLTALQSQIEYEESVSGGDDVVGGLRLQEQEAKQKVISAETAAHDAELAYVKAETALNNKIAEGDTAGSRTALENQKNSIQVSLDAAKKVLEEKQTSLTTLTAGISQTLNIQNLYEAVVKAQETVSEEMKKTQGTTVTADVAGTITAIHLAAGETTAPATPLATIQPEGKGYTMNFSVTKEQARRLSRGDKAELVNSWMYDDVEIVLDKIVADPSNPGQQKLLVFNVTGDVTAGQSMSVSVGQKSADYDFIVPNSAVREDNNGKFILIVEAKNSPLGTRYMAKRVDVEVIAKDDMRSALSASLYGYEFVITTSTKPVEAGELVRLAEN